MRRVLVTGATGFLGRNTLEALLATPRVEVVVACRSPERLQVPFEGELRVGDLRDPDYRASVVQGVDVVCHCGTWGAMWGHAEQEQAWFFEPTVDLIEHSISAGVGRFLLASTVAIASRPSGGPVDDFAPTAKTGFWPHVDKLVELDAYMRANSHRGTEMVTMRLGHFVGPGNELGLVPAIVPRLRTRLVPWLAGGRRRMALVSGADLGRGFALASVAEGLSAHESFNICGPSFPTSREVFSLIARLSGSPRPVFSVPYAAGYAFAWLMEALHPLVGGRAPFLTRSIVHVAEDWYCPTDYARRRIGFEPQVPWQQAVEQSIDELRAHHFPWPSLNQVVS